MPHVRPLLGAVLTAAALAAAGCGSSNGDGDGGAAKASAPASTATAAVPAPAATTPGQAPAAVAPAQTGPRPTKAAYVRRADKVCRAARDVSHSANSVVQKVFQAGDTARAADAIDNYTPLFAEHMSTLKALRQPKGDNKLLTGLIKVMDSQVQALRDEAVALRQQDDATLQQIGKAQQQELQFAEELGRRYGFKVCGRAA
jgi:hypothetical protein